MNLRLGVLNQNVAPDLLAKSLVIPISESEESLVVTWQHRGSHRDHNGYGLPNLNGPIDSLRHTSHIVSISLHEKCFFGPGSLSIVPESPLLAESLARKDLVLIPKSFTEETGVVDYLLRLGLLLGLEA